MFGGVDLLARGQHFCARAYGAGLDAARFTQHVAEQAIEGVDVIGLADLLREVFEVVVIVASGLREMTEFVDEAADHLLHRFFDFAQPLLEQRLAHDEIVEAGFGGLDRRHVERVGQHAHDGGDLAAQPLIVVDQIADVFNE